MVKKLLIFSFITAVLGFGLIAQEDAPAPVETGTSTSELDNTTGLSNFQTDTGRQQLRTILVENMDDPTVWTPFIPFDKGVITMRRLQGNPSGKEPLRSSELLIYNPEDTYVIGLKTEFYGRDDFFLSLQANKPIFIPGIVKSISVWVAGRGKDHELRLVLRDLDGQVFILPVSELNYTGWRQLSINIPLNINQQDKTGFQYGLYFTAFLIETEFYDAEGTYYTYFDDIRAVSDLIADSIIDDDDITDGW